MDKIGYRYIYIYMQYTVYFVYGDDVLYTYTYN